MKKILALALSVLMMPAASGCTTATSNDITLYDKGMELLTNIGTLASNEDYIRFYTYSDEFDDIVASIASTDFSTPTSVHKIEGASDAMYNMLSEQSDIILSEEVLKIVENKFTASLPSLINGMSGSDLLVVSSMLTENDAFLSSEAPTEPIIYLYSFDGEYGGIVSFLPNGDNVVTATGNVVLMSSFGDVDALGDTLSNTFGLTEITVTEITK